METVNTIYKMITANPTKHGTGVQVWGDYGDLNFLYETTSKLMVSEENTQNKYAQERNRLLSYFCYELRHAFQGDRDQKKICYTEDKSTYFGFKIDWVTYVITLSCLRDNMHFVIMNEADIANIRLLEYWGKQAMLAFDEKGATRLNRYIEIGILNDDNLFLFHQQLVCQYYRTKPTVTRFIRIPELLNQLYGASRDRILLENQIKKDAEKLNCDISELETVYDDVDFEW